MVKAALAVMVVLVLVQVLGLHAEPAITCGTVADTLTPCISFVMSGGPALPPANCCNGVRTLYNEARTTPDRQTVCSCLKSVAGSVSEAVIRNAAALPGKCGVDIPYQISPSTDCSKVH